MNIIYLFPLPDWMENCQFWAECILPVGISGWSISVYMSMYLFYYIFYVDCWVECAFFHVRYRCPSAVGIESGRNLAMLFSVKNGHVYRLFFRMAFRSVLFVGIPMLRCKKLRVSLMFPSGIIALIRGSTCFPDGGVFQRVEISTVWWLVPYNLLRLFFCLYLHVHSVL